MVVSMSGGQRLIQRQLGRSLSDAGRRLHLAGELVVAYRPRLPVGGREVFPQCLLERPKQRFAQRVIVCQLNAVVDVTDR